MSLNREQDFGTAEIEQAYEAVVSRIQSDGVGTIVERLARLDDMDLHEIADAIVALYGEVEREWGRQRGQR